MRDLVPLDLLGAADSGGAADSSEERLRIIADSLPAYIAYVDDGLRYRVVNRMYEQQFGRTADEMLGHTVAEVLGDSYRNVQRHLEAALAGTPQHFETALETVAGIRYLGVSHIPDRDAGGRVRGLIIHGLDITDRRRVEEELRVSHQALNLALAAAKGVGTWDWDIASDLVRADATFARLYGVDPAAAQRGAPLSAFTRNIHPEDVERTQAAIAEAIRTGEEYAAEYRLLQADGSVCWVAARGRCSYHDDGSPAHLPGVVVDITERKRTEDALRQTEKLAAVGRLASSIAHEINNPLESVVNLLYLIETSVADSPAEIAGYARLAQEELARISQVTTQTLRFFKQSTAPTRASLAELIASVLSLYKGRLANSGVEVVPRIRYDAALLCYEGEVRQVLNNLIGNAIDAMREGGGRLCLRGRPATDRAGHGPGFLITVADTGHGMSGATAKKIFDPFFTTKGMLGTGLGLWVSKELVAKHGGRLRMRTTQDPIRHGTVFSLFLPDLCDPSAPAS